MGLCAGRGKPAWWNWHSRSAGVYEDKHRTVDDARWAAARAMVLKPEPIFECWSRSAPWRRVKRA